eukprot:8777257-Prorocentrum_lima.AAC.1
MLAATRRCSSRRSYTEAPAVGSKQAADHLVRAGWWLAAMALLVGLAGGICSPFILDDLEDDV